MTSTRYGACIVTAGYALLLAFTAGVANADDDFLGTIRGTVTNAATGEPLRKAYVRLAPASDAANVRTTITDKEGRFIFKDIRSGSYALEAEHQGFIDGKYGDPADVPLELKLIANQDLSGVDIKLMPPAAVSGHVTNEDGDLWTHASVSVFRSSWERGKRQLEGFTSAGVDDKGEFRVGHLPPGRYHLLAKPDGGWEARNRAASVPRLQPTWYPNSLDSSASVPVVLLPGQELTGAGIRLRRSSVYRIRGRVPGIQDIPVLSGAKQWMKPRLSVSFTSGKITDGPSGFLKDDGSFEIEGVPPGSYRIRVEAGMVPEEMSLGSADVQVDDRDVEGVSLPVRASYPLKGVIRPETADTVLPAGLVLWFESAEVSFWKTTKPRSDGSFVFDNVTDGRYRVGVRGGLPGQHYLKSVRYGGVESSNAGFFLSGTIDTIELTLSARGARVSGVVKRKDAGGSTMAQVVLLPETSDADLKSSETRLGVLDQSGAFTVKDAVRPGEYTLYAFEGVPNGAWTDAEFIKEVGGKGVRIKVGEGDVKTVEVPLIPRPDIAALLARLGMD